MRNSTPTRVILHHGGTESTESVRWNLRKKLNECHPERGRSAAESKDLAFPLRELRGSVVNPASPVYASSLARANGASASVQTAALRLCMMDSLRERMGSGDPPGLQNRREAG